MDLIEFYRNGDKVVYSITVNGKDYYFYDGFDNEEDAVNVITKYFNDIFDNAFLLRSGIWSKIIK